MANYNIAINRIIVNEGGYQNHPNDKGNYNSEKVLIGTNHGISAPVLERWRGYVPAEHDMRNLSQNESLRIYKKNYWLPIWGDQIKDQDSADIIFDHSVNAGTGNGAKLAQRTLNKLGRNLVVDGAIGRKTIVALNSTDPTLFFETYKKGRIDFYRSISSGSNSVFLNGWIKRVLTFEKKKQLPLLVY